MKEAVKAERQRQHLKKQAEGAKEVKKAMQKPHLEEEAMTLEAITEAVCGRKQR
jgi:uncharacterized protein YjgD (DUF1641 family)